MSPELKKYLFACRNTIYDRVEDILSVDMENTIVKINLCNNNETWTCGLFKGEATELKEFLCELIS